MLTSVNDCHVYLGGARQKLPYKDVLVRAYVDREVIPMKQARDQFTVHELQTWFAWFKESGEAMYGPAGFAEIIELLTGTSVNDVSEEFIADANRCSVEALHYMNSLGINSKGIKHSAHWHQRDARIRNFISNFTMNEVIEDIRLVPVKYAKASGGHLRFALCLGIDGPEAIDDQLNVARLGATLRSHLGVNPVPMPLIMESKEAVVEVYTMLSHGLEQLQGQQKSNYGISDLGYCIKHFNCSADKVLEGKWQFSVSEATESFRQGDMPWIEDAQLVRQTFVKRTPPTPIGESWSPYPASTFTVNMLEMIEAKQVEDRPEWEEKQLDVMRRLWETLPSNEAINAIALGDLIQLYDRAVDAELWVRVTGIDGDSIATVVDRTGFGYFEGQTLHIERRHIFGIVPQPVEGIPQAAAAL